METPVEHPPNYVIRHSTLIHAEPMQVYQALTTPQGLDAWFTIEASLNATPGGEIHFRWQNCEPDHISTKDGGPVLEAIPGKRFIFQRLPIHQHITPLSELNLALNVGGTIVSLRGYGFADNEPGTTAMIDNTAYWGETLTLLKFYLEHGLHH